MIYVTVFVLIIAYRAVYAGIYHDTVLCKRSTMDFDKVFVYGAVTLGVALTWPISLPIYGLYMIGKKLKKGS